MSSARWAVPSRAVPIGVLAVFLLVLAAHLALLPAGRWHGDEFLQFGMLRAYGLAGLRVRLLGWSPRPLSEVLDTGYGLAVLATHRPLIGPVLALCWAIAGLGIWWGTGRGAGRGAERGAARAVLAAGLGCAFLLRHPLADMAYWPLAAVAYLPALSGVSFAVLRVLRGGPGWRGAAAGGLTLAAGSAEIGAFFAAIAGVILCVEGVHRTGIRGLSSPRHPAHAAPPAGSGGRAPGLVFAFPVLLAPVLLALAVVVLLLHGRVAQARERMGDGPLFHHAWPSLAAGLAAGLGPPFQHLLPVLLLLAGFAALLRAMDWPAPPPWRAMALLAACAGTMVLSAAAAEYQFGTLCCERHATFRDCLAILGLVVLAALAAPALPASPAWPALGATLLLAGLAPGMWQRAPALLSDLRSLHAVQSGRQADWHAGFASPPDAAPMMTYRLLPPGAVTGAFALPPGRYAQGPGAPWAAQGVMLFFGRAGMRVVQ